MTTEDLMSPPITDHQVPLERASALPAEWYRSEEFFDAERDRIFSRTWVAVGRVDQVSKPGDCFTCTVAGEPLVVTRTAQGRLSASINVCRHREPWCARVQATARSLCAQTTGGPTASTDPSGTFPTSKEWLSS